MSILLLISILLIVVSIISFVLTRAKQKNTFVSDFFEVFVGLIGVIGVIVELVFFMLPTESNNTTDIPSEPETSNPTTVLESGNDSSSVTSNSTTALKIGDIIPMGKYEQDGNSSEKEDIQWRVLDIQNDSALLLSEYILDYMVYYDGHKGIVWEKATLRKWMNEEFLNSAFTVKEKAKIKLATIKNHGNQTYGTDGGTSTKDKVFALSFKEAEKYLSDDNIIAYTTTYAKNVGAGDGSASWWLRTPGKDSFSSMIASKDGHIYSNSYCDHRYELGVRPAMWIYFK